MIFVNPYIEACETVRVRIQQLVIMLNECSCDFLWGGHLLSCCDRKKDDSCRYRS
jgi:hypothetical protein